VVATGPVMINRDMPRDGHQPRGKARQVVSIPVSRAPGLLERHGCQIFDVSRAAHPVSEEIVDVGQLGRIQRVPIGTACGHNPRQQLKRHDVARRHSNQDTDNPLKYHSRRSRQPHLTHRCPDRQCHSVRRAGPRAMMGLSHNAVFVCTPPVVTYRMSLAAERLHLVRTYGQLEGRNHVIRPPFRLTTVSLTSRRTERSRPASVPRRTLTSCVLRGLRFV
jgi:hypothetical protein